MQEVIFVINESIDGGFEAEALGVSIFTSGDSWVEFKENIIESISCHFDDLIEKNNS